jgi:hypothetical protein
MTRRTRKKRFTGHLKSLKVFETQQNIALKRLASAVDAVAWPLLSDLCEPAETGPRRSGSEFLCVAVNEGGHAVEFSFTEQQNITAMRVKRINIAVPERNGKGNHT